MIFRRGAENSDVAAAACSRFLGRKFFFRAKLKKAMIPFRQLFLLRAWPPETDEKAVNIRRVDSGNRSRKGADEPAHDFLNVAHVVIACAPLFQVLEIFL